MAPVVAPTKTAPRARRRRRDVPSLDDVQHFVIEDASWALYERLLREAGGRNVRITYDDGRLELMSPLAEHEEVKKVIAKLIDALAEEAGVEMKSLGSTTFRRRDRGKGFEPDECYYFKAERRMRGRRRIDLKRDPPPELIVELDLTHSSVDREPVYAALGVPEIWRWDGARLQCLELHDGAYRVREKSLAFPAFAPGDLTRFVRMRTRTGENALVRKFREWARAQPWARS